MSNERKIATLRRTWQKGFRRGTIAYDYARQLKNILLMCWKEGYFPDEMHEETDTWLESATRAGWDVEEEYDIATVYVRKIFFLDDSFIRVGYVKGDEGMEYPVAWIEGGML